MSPTPVSVLPLKCDLQVQVLAGLFFWEEVRIGSGAVEELNQKKGDGSLRENRPLFESPPNQSSFNGEKGPKREKSASLRSFLKASISFS